jgi:antitoxin ParD1/3/4
VGRRDNHKERTSWDVGRIETSIACRGSHIPLLNIAGLFAAGVRKAEIAKGASGAVSPTTQGRERWTQVAWHKLPFSARDAMVVGMAVQTSMNVSLPQNLRHWVEDQVANQGYGTASEYFRELVREDQKRRAREELDRKLIAALASGESTEMTAEDWKKIRSTVHQRLARKAKAGK